VLARSEPTKNGTREHFDQFYICDDVQLYFIDINLNIKQVQAYIRLMSLPETGAV